MSQPAILETILKVASKPYKCAGPQVMFLYTPYGWVRVSKKDLVLVDADGPLADQSQIGVAEEYLVKQFGLSVVL